MALKHPMKTTFKKWKTKAVSLFLPCIIYYNYIGELYIVANMISY